MNREEAKQQTEEFEARQKVIKGYQKKLNEAKKSVASNKAEIERIKAELKKTTDKSKKDSLNQRLQDLKKEQTNLKIELETLKDSVKMQRTTIDNRLDQFIEQDPAIKKYILYTEGKVFDENIAKNNVKIAKIDQMDKILKGNLDGQEAKKTGKDLKNLSDKYTKVNEEIKKAKETLNKYHVNPKTNADFQKLVAQKQALSNDIKAKMNELDGQLPVGAARIEYNEFMNILDNVPEGKTIEEGMKAQKETAQKNIKNNEKALEEVMKEGKALNTKFVGFSNYHPKTQTLPALPPQRSFWYKVFHPIKYGREQDDKKKIEQKMEKQRQADSKLETYGASEYNMDDIIKKDKNIKEKMGQEIKERLERASKEQDQER